MNTPEIYFLKSQRLGFRRWRKNDLDIAVELWGDSKVTLLIDSRGTLTRDQVQERLRTEIATAEQYGIQYWPIFRFDTGEHLGCCGLRPYEVSKQIYELGFHIRSAHWRQGYAFEAAQTVIGYAFNKLKAAALFAGHHPKNDSSRRLLMKLGFRFTHDEYYPPTGLNHPSYLLNLRFSNEWMSTG